MKRGVFSKATDLALFTMAYLLVANTGFAQERSIPLGGRTATMGGAATAAGNDSAMPFLTPAGMAGVPLDVVAVSANAYAITQRKFEGLLYPTGYNPLIYGRNVKVVKDDIQARTIQQLPTAIMYMRHIGDSSWNTRHVLGVSLTIPQQARYDIFAQNAADMPQYSGKTSYTSASTISSTTYHLGPTYALQVRDSLKLGISLFATYTNSTYIQQDNINIQLHSGVDQLQATNNNSIASSTYSMMSVIGIQYSPVKPFWLGLGFATPSVAISGRSDRTSNTKIFSQAGSGLGSDLITASTVTTVRVKEHPPPRLNAGLAYDNRERFSLAFDIFYVFGSSDAISARSSSRTQHSSTGDIARNYTEQFSSKAGSESLFDISIGGEVKVLPWLALRSGFFTANSTAEDVNPAKSASGTTLVKEERWGISAGTGLQFGSFDSTLGLVFEHGSGKLLGVNPSDATPFAAPFTTNAIYFVLSAAVSREQAQKEIKENIPQNGPSIPGVFP